MRTRTSLELQNRGAGSFRTATFRLPTAALIAFAIAWIVSLLSARHAHAHTAFVYLYDRWRYEASGMDLGTSWRDPGYDDSGWLVGEAPIGDGDPSYTINFTTKIPIAQATTYFRIAFDIIDVDATAITSVIFNTGYTHGFVAYINGQEVARRGLAPGPVTFSTPAPQYIPTAIETITVPNAQNVLVSGKNVLAVELHQTAPPTNVLLWAAEVLFSTSAPHVTRGPFLQVGTPRSTIIRWRTSVPTDSLVRYGLAPNQLDQVAPAAALTTEHEVTLNGLSPATRYYYSIGSATAVLAGGDEAHSFVTSPPVGTPAPTRIWVLGDSGTKNDRQRAVRDAYYAFSAGRRTDLWLMLGDNAYPSGTDHDHQFAIFEGMYEDMLRTSVLWPTIGNHDWQDGTVVPYFDVFTLPTQGEAGGAASGTERYYSFDHANIHFVCLHTDVYTDDIVTWLGQDLAQSSQPWTIAFLHKPPHTRGSHDSDTEGDIDWVRDILAPVLEDGGVDLVLAGHSHNYERSMLLDNFYGLTSEFAANPGLYTVNGGDGREDGDGAYTKPGAKGPHQGTVYVVSGNSGGRGDGAMFPLDHPVMVELFDPHSGLLQRGLGARGSLVLDVDNGRLDAQYVDFQGNVLDHFTIRKGMGPVTPPPPDDSGGNVNAKEIGGCGCRAVGNRAGGAGGWLILLVVLAARRSKPLTGNRAACNSSLLRGARLR